LPSATPPVVEDDNKAAVNFLEHLARLGGNDRARLTQVEEFGKGGRDDTLGIAIQHKAARRDHGWRPAPIIDRTAGVAPKLDRPERRE
jgi:hypothetical protein